VIGTNFKTFVFVKCLCCCFFYIIWRPGNWAFIKIESCDDLHQCRVLQGQDFSFLLKFAKRAASCLQRVTYNYSLMAIKISPNILTAFKYETVHGFDCILCSLKSRNRGCMFFKLHDQ